MRAKQLWSESEHTTLALGFILGSFDGESGGLLRSCSQVVACVCVCVYQRSHVHVLFFVCLFFVPPVPSSTARSLCFVTILYRSPIFLVAPSEDAPLQKATFKREDFSQSTKAPPRLKAHSQWRAAVTANTPRAASAGHISSRG